MANRNFSQDRYTLEKGVTELYATVTVATGAVTLKKWNPPGSGSAGSYSAAPTSGTKYAKGYGGISSVARTAAGAWTITFQDPYVRLLGVNAMFSTSSAATAAPLVSVDASGNVTTASGGTVKLLFQATASGGGVDPTDGDVMLTFTLQNSSAR